MTLRSVWKGSLGFGLVNVPVKLYGSIEEQTIHFNQLHKVCGKRIQMPRFCSFCESQVASEDIQKGYAIAKDQYIMLEEGEMASLPVKSLKAIEVLEFIEASLVDVRQYDTPYFVSPEVGGGKAFALLLKGMEQVGKVAVAKLAMREREHLCTVRPFGKVLLLQTLHWADELRDSQQVETDLPDVSERELELASQLIKAMVGKGDLSQYEDEYRKAVVALIEAKVAGTVIQVQPVEESKPTEDVMAGLLASIEAMKAA